MKRSEISVTVFRFESHADNQTFVRRTAHIVVMAGGRQPPPAGLAPWLRFL